MAPLAFGTTGAGAASWATRAPGGSDAADLALLRQLEAPLATVYELKALHRVAAELLGTYVGEDRQPRRRRTNDPDYGS